MQGSDDQLTKHERVVKLYVAVLLDALLKPDTRHKALVQGDLLTIDREVHLLAGGLDL